MIISEEFTIGDVNYVRHKSDSGFLIQRDNDGVKFADVVDVVKWGHTYTETDIPIPKVANNVSSAEALKIITGGAT